jgi:hypothetical protein
MKIHLPCQTSHKIALLLGLLVTVFGGCSSAKNALSNDTAYVAPEKMRLRSSTAEAARNVGEVKSGDQVSILERKNEGNTTWANVSGPGGASGWIETRYLVKQEIVNASSKIAEELREIPTQAVGKSKATLKLRLTPDRANDDNVAFPLPAGTTLEIVARERRPRPEKLEAAAKPATAQGNPTASPTPNAPKYDEWFKVRLPNYSIVPAGWIYGGSVELEVPGEITFFLSTGRRITGWQKIGSVTDDTNQSHDSFLVVEKNSFDADERGDFDRVKILAYDPKRREYGTPFREDVLGQFPVVLKMEGSRGQFSLSAVNPKDGQAAKIHYTVELLEGGKAKVTRQPAK